MPPGTCCAAGMDEVDAEGVTDKMTRFVPNERGDTLVTGYQCVECARKWLKTVDTEYPDFSVWNEQF